jgi:glycosyltransferase involved in cell wall biosynthesis
VRAVDLPELTDPPALLLSSLTEDFVVLNNRPLWAEHVGVPCFHVMHNYPGAWGTGSDDVARVHRVLARAAGIGAVSRSLAGHIEEAYRPGVPVREARVAVEEGFFEVEWEGEGGPVIFPNRLLEKKGVRFFLEVAEILAADGIACVMFRHVAPFVEPTPEQLELLDLIGRSRAVSLVDPPSTRGEMAQWYASAGAVVCCSTEREGLGLVALESQAVGAPLLTSGLGGLAEATLAPNPVVQGFSATRWAAAVRAELGPQDRERIAARRRASLTIWERYSPAVASGSLAELFELAEVHVQIVSPAGTQDGWQT